MQSKSGSKNYGRYVSIGITVAIVIMMVLSGPVTAVSLGITELDGTTHTKGNSVTFNVTATIEGTDSYVPIDSFALQITGATSKEITYSTDGTILSGSGITVEAVEVPSSSSEYGQGYGYDSRLGSGHDFGYGYGYGTGGADLVYEYTITLDTSTLNAGVHNAVLSLNTGDSAKPSFESSSASFTIESSSSSRSSSSGGGGGGSGSTGEAYDNIEFKEVKTENIVGGLEISYAFGEEQNAIQYINFSAVRNYQRTSTTIEVLKDRSEMVDESAPGLVYSNLNIWVGKSGFATEDNIADPVISFRVPKDWITENGIDENLIVLYRHSEGKWNALNTGKVGEDDLFIYFEAETPGFSPFAIAADVDDEVLTENTTSTEDDSSAVNITVSSEEELNASGTEEENGSGLNILFIIVPVLLVLIVLYASYAAEKSKRDNGGDNTADLPDDVQVAESDDSKTAPDITNAEEISSQSAKPTPESEEIPVWSAKTAPATEQIPVRSAKPKPAAEEISGQSADTTPTAKEVLGEPVETIPTVEEMLGYSAETKSDDVENKVQSEDTEQESKEMKESGNFSDDGWTQSTTQDNEVRSDDTEQKTKEPKRSRTNPDDKW
ncbi:PGF-pre-PGF domain-containing protein [Methanococcoides sp. AM1]|uniref:PGF-pre-PGF domain-containing protein n=1 Tax=Methanococcoides sp. AM1 TaxID=1201011 RepID=UPI0014383B77|nr:PGF-pre-PGF domain-containing protein [Methanococcoides sp. AM1]